MQPLTTHKGRVSNWLSKVTNFLVIIVAITGIALLLFRFYPSSVDGSPAGAMGTQETIHTQAGGLELLMRLTPGPYFLSELVVADISLTNHTQTTFMLEGPSGAGPCGAAVFLGVTGGTAPTYTLPVSTEHSCPLMHTQLKPDETLTFHHFIPLSKSGDITLQPGARFLHTQIEPDGSKNIISASSPLDGDWPSINITVTSRVPMDREISLQPQGAQIRINAPVTAHAHLYYLYNVTCDAFQGGTVGTGNFAWEPLPTPILHKPDCGDYGNQNIHWYYAVSAPGYAIVSGQNHTN